MVTKILLAVTLFAQTANPWDGTWKWATLPERAAWDAQWKAQVQQYADENCGRPYFGTYCRRADGTFGFA